MMAQVSAVILTLNEGDYLEACLSSIDDWVDEIIIIDGGSTDDTIDIAQQYTDDIYFEESKRGEGFDHLRHRGIEQASNEYILDLDADEHVPDTVADRLSAIANKNSVDVVEVPRKNILFGRWAKGAGWWPGYQPKLFRRGSIRFSANLHNFRTVDGTAKVVQLPAEERHSVVHYNHDTVEDMVSSMNRYSTIESRQTEFSWKLLFVDPVVEFGRRFILHRGWRLGTFGFVLCSLRFCYKIILAIKAYYQDKAPSDGV